jgi:uncharacterized protein (DUF488 family)
MKLFTIGFTRKSAERFFETLHGAGVERLIDVRLNNRSQLAGFAKRDDLRYFLERICGIEYLATGELAPEPAMLAAYRRDRAWHRYSGEYRDLIARREVERSLAQANFRNACLLCSEHEPEHCHRTIAAEYLQQQWGDVQIVHLR